MAAEIKINMTLTKETKGTFVYGAADTAIPTLYIKKEAFSGPAPKEIQVVISS